MKFENVTRLKISSMALIISSRSRSTSTSPTPLWLLSETVFLSHSVNRHTGQLPCPFTQGGVATTCSPARNVSKHMDLYACLLSCSIAFLNSASVSPGSSCLGLGCYPAMVERPRCPPSGWPVMVQAILMLRRLGAVLRPIAPVRPAAAHLAGDRSCRRLAGREWIFAVLNKNGDGVYLGWDAKFQEQWTHDKATSET
uniref:Uncharacterized protein n=2 Tax=Oryza glumipatula TaxID=40148 RepID=A0A0E0B1P8_9ORYZ